MQNSKENRRKAAISTLCSLFRRLAGVPFTGSRCNNVVAYLECFLWPRAKKWPLVLKYHVSMYVYSCGLATCMLLVRSSKWFETLPASFKQSRLCCVFSCPCCGSFTWVLQDSFVPTASFILVICHAMLLSIR